MIVIDTNVLAYWLIDASTPALKKLAERVLEKEPRVLLPSLWRHEFLNILSNYAKKGLLTTDAAEACWYEAVADVQDSEAEVDMVRALEISTELGISAYDAQFLALAEGARTVLVTGDRRLCSLAKGLAVSMEDYLAA